MCDASPWGLGAVLIVDGHISAYLWDVISEQDHSILQTSPGPEGQAIFEGLAVLVAARTWMPEWHALPTTIIMQSDSLAALGSAAKLGSSVPKMNMVVRELALEFAEGMFEIGLFGHIPGHLNTLADALSRLFDPNGPKELPEMLANVPRTIVQERCPSWWRTRGTPATSR